MEEIAYIYIPASLVPDVVSSLLPIIALRF